jgi:VanZ family protein
MEVVIWIGLGAIYLLVALRMNVPEERSHLIEYGVLAVFMLETLRERKKQIGTPKYAAWCALGLTTAIGILDEGIQLLVPHRVFDFVDIGFNFIAASLAIGGSVVIEWIRTRVSNSLKKQ